MKEWVEYAAVWVILKGLAVLPGPLARSLAAGAVRIFYALLPGLRKTAELNLAHCLSGVEQRAAQDNHPRNAAKFGLDGRGICQISEVFEREHHAACRARGARKLFRRPAARERRALSDGAHRRVGVVFICPRALRISSALHGPANRQSED